MTVDAIVAEELRPNMYSYLNLDGGHTAYIIGNGTSRQGLDLNVLSGDIWGCNALFRDYTPDYLTIVDVSIKEFIKPDIYLLNDKKNYFLATIEFSKISENKLSVKPYFNNFSPFQIDANLLKISGKILWQCSKTLK